MTESVHKLFTRLILMVLIAALAVLSARLLELESKYIAPADDVSFRWHPKLYRFITFGHAPAAVDLLLIRFFAEDTLKHVSDGSRAKAFYLIDLATDLDPAFFYLYYTGANYLTVVRDDNRSALDIAEKGDQFRINRLPEMPEYIRNVIWEHAWRIPFVKGYIYLFEFEDLAGAKNAYSELAVMSGVPAAIMNLADRFNKTDGEYEVGLRVLETMILSEQEKKNPDPQVVDEFTKRRDSLLLSYSLKNLNRKFSEFLLEQSPARSARSPLVDPRLLNNSWQRFLETNRISDRDVWGGRLFLDENGRVNSTTPREKVLGLE